MTKYAICFATDKKYAKYCYVAVFSVLQNISHNFNCEIIVLTTPDVPDEFSGLFSELSNSHITVRTIQTSSYVAQFGIDKLFTSRHITSAAYLRLLIPDIFFDYTTVLYLDSDVIVLGDVTELLFFDLSHHTLGCHPDTDRHRMDSWRIQFIQDELKIPPMDYFNSGVLLYNIPVCREFNLLAKSLQFFEHIPEPPFHDQDALNAVMHGTTARIPSEWHIMSYFIGKKRLSEVMDLRPELLKDYLLYTKAMRSPKLVHFPGSSKPWFQPFIPYGDKWWEYAEKTTIYGKYFRRTKRPQIIEYI